MNSLENMKYPGYVDPQEGILSREKFLSRVRERGWLFDSVHVDENVRYARIVHLGQQGIFIPVDFFAPTEWTKLVNEAKSETLFMYYLRNLQIKKDFPHWSELYWTTLLINKYTAIHPRLVLEDQDLWNFHTPKWSKPVFYALKIIFFNDPANDRVSLPLFDKRQLFEVDIKGQSVTDMYISVFPTLESL
jgi:hypothetical protein